MVRPFIAACHVAGWWSSEKTLLLGIDCWPVGAASEPLGLGVFGYRASLACFIGTLAAVPGSVVMLAHHLGRQRAARESAFNAWWKRKA